MGPGKATLLLLYSLPILCFVGLLLWESEFSGENTLIGEGLMFLEVMTLTQGASITLACYFAFMFASQLGLTVYRGNSLRRLSHTPSTSLPRTLFHPVPGGLSRPPVVVSQAPKRSPDGSGDSSSETAENARGPLQQPRLDALRKKYKTSLFPAKEHGQENAFVLSGSPVLLFLVLCFISAICTATPSSNAILRIYLPNILQLTAVTIFAYPYENFHLPTCFQDFLENGLGLWCLNQFIVNRGVGYPQYEFLEQTALLRLKCLSSSATVDFLKRTLITHAGTWLMAPTGMFSNFARASAMAKLKASLCWGYSQEEAASIILEQKLAGDLSTQGQDDLHDGLHDSPGFTASMAFAESADSMDSMESGNHVSPGISDDSRTPRVQGAPPTVSFDAGGVLGSLPAPEEFRRQAASCFDVLETEAIQYLDSYAIPLFLDSNIGRMFVTQASALNALARRGEMPNLVYREFDSMFGRERDDPVRADSATRATGATGSRLPPAGQSSPDACGLGLLKRVASYVPLLPVLIVRCAAMGAIPLHVPFFGVGQRGRRSRDRCTAALVQSLLAFFGVKADEWTQCAIRESQRGEAAADLTSQENLPVGHDTAGDMLTALSTSSSRFQPFQRAEALEAIFSLPEGFFPNVAGFRGNNFIERIQKGIFPTADGASGPDEPQDLNLNTEGRFARDVEADAHNAARLLSPASELDTEEALRALILVASTSSIDFLAYQRAKSSYPSDYDQYWSFLRRSMLHSSPLDQNQKVILSQVRYHGPWDTAPASLKREDQVPSGQADSAESGAQLRAMRMEHVGAVSTVGAAAGHPLAHSSLRGKAVTADLDSESADSGLGDSEEQPRIASPRPLELQISPQKAFHGRARLAMATLQSFVLGDSVIDPGTSLELNQLITPIVESFSDSTESSDSSPVVPLQDSSSEALPSLDAQSEALDTSTLAPALDSPDHSDSPDHLDPLESSGSQSITLDLSDDSSGVQATNSDAPPSGIKDSDIKGVPDEMRTQDTGIAVAETAQGMAARPMSRLGVSKGVSGPVPSTLRIARYATQTAPSSADSSDRAAERATEVPTSSPPKGPIALNTDTTVHPVLPSPGLPGTRSGRGRSRTNSFVNRHLRFGPMYPPYSHLTSEDVEFYGKFVVSRSELLSCEIFAATQEGGVEVPDLYSRVLRVYLLSICYHLRFLDLLRLPPLSIFLLSEYLTEFSTNRHGESSVGKSNGYVFRRILLLRIHQFFCIAHALLTDELLKAKLSKDEAASLMPNEFLYSYNYSEGPGTQDRGESELAVRTMPERASKLDYVASITHSRSQASPGSPGLAVGAPVSGRGLSKSQLEHAVLPLQLNVCGTLTSAHRRRNLTAGQPSSQALAKAMRERRLYSFVELLFAAFLSILAQCLGECFQSEACLLRAQTSLSKLYNDHSVVGAAGAADLWLACDRLGLFAHFPASQIKRLRLHYLAMAKLTGPRAPLLWLSQCRASMEAFVAELRSTAGLRGAVSTGTKGEAFEGTVKLLLLRAVCCMTSASYLASPPRASLYATLIKMVQHDEESYAESIYLGEGREAPLLGNSGLLTVKVREVRIAGLQEVVRPWIEGAEMLMEFLGGYRTTEALMSSIKAAGG